MAADDYDVFLSHAWADGERPRQIADALSKAGLRVWFDANEIDDFAGITRAVTNGLAHSKALLSYYSKTYPQRRACQWELTAAFLAAQAEGDPRRRVLVINPENSACHIHPIELRDAKFRDAPNTDSEMAELVDAIVNHLDEIAGTFAGIQPLSAPPWYGMNPVGSTRFVGRVAEMWNIHSLLHAADVAQITGAAAATGGMGQIHGLAGVGKSMVAEEYALRFGAAYPGGIFWLSAYGNDDAKAALGPAALEAERTTQVRQIAERLGITVQGQTIEQVEGELGRALAKSGKPCLWVVDDVPNGLNAEVLRRWFAPHSIARTLLTTRSRAYRSLANGIDLAVLTPAEAFQLLTSRRKPAGKDEEQQARELANDLGHHALALDVTASALLSYSGEEPYRKFRDELSHYDEDALELATELADALPNGHEPSIAKTMLRSIRGLGPEGQDFLRLAASLAAAPIPASLVTAVFEKSDRLERGIAEQRQRKAFHQVTQASLAEIASEDARSVHALVSRAMRLHEKPAFERSDVLRVAAIQALTDRLSAIDHIGDHFRIAIDVPHARHLLAKGLQTGEQVLLAGWLAHRDRERGDYGSARKLQEQVLEARRRVLGGKHPDTLTAMNNLARTLSAQGDYAAARNLEEDAFEARRRVLGDEHPDTLAAMNNLAATLSAQGDHAAARKLETRVLEARRRVLGGEHPDTLRATNNLGLTLYEQGDYAAARKLQKQALEASRRVLGNEHPQTLTAMLNLAATLYEQGDYAAAHTLQQQALEALRRVLGDEHPNTLTAMNNLALTLNAQGDHAAGRKWQQQVLEASRRVLGDEHPNTLAAMLNLAQTLSAQVDRAAARKLQEQVLEALRRVLGDDHPDTLKAMNNLALTLYAQGDHAAARQLQQQALEARRRVLGDEHPETRKAMNNLAGM